MKTENRSAQVQNLALAALFMAAGLVLPFLTGQIPQIGSMLLPMHLPVLLCGLVCGWQYGALVGAILPLLRYLLFGMPPVFPTGVAMCFELAAYGFLAGWLYAHSRWKCVKALYACLIPAMIGGRLVWGVVEVVLLGLTGSAFTWSAFLAGCSTPCRASFCSWCSSRPLWSRWTARVSAALAQTPPPNRQKNRSNKKPLRPKRKTGRAKI